MNREAFYRTIGDIDDDLILAAADAYAQPAETSELRENSVRSESTGVSRGRRRKTVLRRLAGLAACFCLLCAGLMYSLQADTIYIHKISAPPIAKLVVPEGAEAVSVSAQELLDYYGIGQLPEVLAEDVISTEQTYFALYQDQEGNILFDTNNFYYRNADGSRTLTLTLTGQSDASAAASSIYDKLKKSRIDGVPVVLGDMAPGTHNPVYLAEFELAELSVRMIAEGLSEEDFTGAAAELIQALKA